MIASKTTKSSIFFTVQGPFEAFFYKWNLSRDESSPIQQVCPCFRRFSVLVHEVYGQQLNKNSEKWKFQKFSNFSLFRCQIRTVFVWKTAFISFLNVLDNTFFPCWPFSTFQLTKSVGNLGKMHKTLDNRKILGFLSFSVSIWDFFIWKTAITSSKSLLDNELGPCWAFSTI